MKSKLLILAIVLVISVGSVASCTGGNQAEGGIQYEEPEGEILVYDYSTGNYVWLDFRGGVLHSMTVVPESEAIAYIESVIAGD